MFAARVAARATARVAAVTSRSVVPVRRMGGGHGHGHGGPAKVLEPRPELPANATLKQRIAHSMYYKRNPDYNGVEAYIRYVLPSNHQIVYAVLGLYATLIAVTIVNKAADAKEAKAKAPAPGIPDYHSVAEKSSAVPSFGTDEWVTFIADPANEAAWVASLDKEEA